MAAKVHVLKCTILTQSKWIRIRTCFQHAWRTRDENGIKKERLNTLHTSCLFQHELVAVHDGRCRKGPFGSLDRGEWQRHLPQPPPASVPHCYVLRRGERSPGGFDGGAQWPPVGVDDATQSRVFRLRLVGDRFGIRSCEKNCWFTVGVNLFKCDMAIEKSSPTEGRIQQNAKLM